ncbi:MAG: preprotein translocase subunit SecG [Chlamydiae bacterium]|nr:preprotein translocase subunit SecG [Chlamydiota bacterium]
MTFIFYLFLFLFLFLCVVLTFTILIQDAKNMGLGASFGGDSSQSLFGTATADVLKKFTAYLIIIFMIACVVLSLWTNALGRPKVLTTEMIEETQK